MEKIDITLQQMKYLWLSRNTNYRRNNGGSGLRRKINGETLELKYIKSLTKGGQEWILLT